MSRNSRISSLWVGSWGARSLLVFSISLALIALSISGSFYQAARATLEGVSRSEESSWQIILSAFLSDITGTPGLFISAVKTLVAIVVAFIVTMIAPSGAGKFSLNVFDIELSGKQSAAMTWCIVFLLVKLL